MTRFVPLLVLILCACSDPERLPSVAVQKESLRITLTAEGSLRAASATPITVPPLAGPQILAYLAPANSPVSQGDVVARFDDTQFQLDAADADTELQKLALQAMEKERVLASSMVEMDHSREEVDIEKAMADQFNTENPLLYSRLEMIDSMRDEKFLNAQIEFFTEKGELYGEKSEAEIGVIETQKGVQAAKLQRSKDNMNMLELLAPHDGLFIPENNWAGEPPRAGQSIFPGFKLATLPDLSEMEAEIFVAEKEAIGLAEGLGATVILDAFPDRPIGATVKSISRTAQPRKRGNPVKYFTVIVALEKTESEWMIPGRRLSVEIVVADLAEAVSVPNQALFTDADKAYVYVESGDSFERAPVELGVRGTSRTQVTSGLTGNERVALIEPQASAS